MWFRVAALRWGYRLRLYAPMREVMAAFRLVHFDLATDQRREFAAEFRNQLAQSAMLRLTPRHVFLLQYSITLLACHIRLVQQQLTFRAAALLALLLIPPGHDEILPAIPISLAPLLHRPHVSQPDSCVGRKELDHL